MFLFCSDASILRQVRKSAVINRFGDLNIIRINGAALLWTADAFTVVGRTPKQVTVQMRRPSLDRDAVCELGWNLSDNSIRLRRRWSGEFSAYIKQHRRSQLARPLTVVSSHLKLVPLFTKLSSDAFKRIEPGQELTIQGTRMRNTIEPRWSAPFDLEYGQTVRKVRQLILQSVASLPNRVALLLSGGIDSSAIAAAACLSGKRIFAFTFTLDRLIRAQRKIESDLINARQVAEHLGIPLVEIEIPHGSLIRNVPLGIYLGETARGTIVDDCAALIEVARNIERAGFSQVCMGEAADDLFGGFKFALRLYRGAQLRAYYRSQLTRDLPNELAIIQNIFAPFGISVIQPMWTPELLGIGYNLPLRFRMDRRRLMKRVLRDAFRADLPLEIVNRPKCVTRDSTQSRYVLEEVFGCGRDRYRPLFRSTMGDMKWQRKFRQAMKK